MKTILIGITTVILISSFGFTADISRAKVVEQFIKSNSKLRVSQSAVKEYMGTLNQMSLKVVKKATELAKTEKRKTVLDRDIEQASDEVFRRAPITVKELMEKITLLSIIDLAALSNQVKAHANKLIEQKK